VYKIDGTGAEVPQTIVTFKNDPTGAAHSLITNTMDETKDVGTFTMRLVVSLPDALYPKYKKDF